MSLRIGVYSGTFDPVHPGHIAFAHAAMETCKLDKVIFLPERAPRNKHNITDISHRTALLQKVTVGAPGLGVVSLGSSQFTVQETLPELRRMFADAEITFLVGSDIVLHSLSNWTDLGVLLGEVSLAIGLRGEDTPEVVAKIVGEIEKQHSVPVRFTCIQTKHANLASSHIRNNTYDAAELGPAVAEYIRLHKLYG